MVLGIGTQRGARAGAAAAVAVAVLGIAGCGKKAEAPAARPPADVTAMTVTPRDTPITFEFVAQTQSSQLVNIQARVNGFLDRRVYTEGAVVKAGDVLFLIDPKPFKVQLDAAQAALQRNVAAMEVARSNLARIKPLTAQNALSQKDLDDATGQYETSQASVEQARAQVESARLDLSYATITSPVNGITSEANVAVGSYVGSTNNQLTTVAVLSPMWVNFSVSENQVQRLTDEVRAGTLRTPRGESYVVELILVDGSVYPHTGSITFAAPSFNPQTGTFTVRASVINPQGTLRPKQFVRVRLNGAVRPNAILVPQRAVQQGSKGHFVWVVSKDGKAEPRPVQVGDWLGDDWFITQGLAGGEQVVVDGLLTLQPGAPVKATPVAAGAGSAAAAAAAKGAAKPADAGAGKGDGKDGLATAGAPAVAAAAGGAAGAAPAGGAAPVPAVVLFDPGRATLSADARATIGVLAQAIQRSNASVAITGFTDRTGNAAANTELAKARAKAVRDALAAAGVRAERLVLAPPAAVTGSGPDAEARRVEITTSAAR